MTYFGFLGLFLLIPISLVVVLTILDRRWGKKLPDHLRAWPTWAAILLHVVIALLYTTIWDNYLVATRVWWYDPELVTGFTIGWVPIEEYTFFILQPLLAGLWFVLLAKRSFTVIKREALKGYIRFGSTTAVGILWVASVIALLAGWQPATYMALELGWALPPIATQLAFGADILWRKRRLVSLTIISLTLYLSAADAVAISLGTWTINPQKSFDWLIAGILPVEEFLFFLLTNTLITFGILLILSRESHVRLASIRQKFVGSRSSG